MKVLVARGEIELLQGDITRVEVDAVVNAANEGLRGGGGVDGAIHRAGGRRIMEECRLIGRCPTGEAVVTTGGDLAARHVIHAVGPVWRGGGQGERELLRSAYLQSLRRAEEAGAASLAFPALSTGAYGYPLAEASEVALTAGIEYLRGGGAVRRLVYVLFAAAELRVYQETLARLAAG